MAKIYVRPELGSKVQQLRYYLDVVTASDKGIIMLTRDDWNKVCTYIDNFDKETKTVKIDFFECGTLWSDCFWPCYYSHGNSSFMAINDHHIFMRICNTLHVQPILLEVPYNIPFLLSHNICGNKPQNVCNFEIEVEDN